MTGIYPVTQNNETRGQLLQDEEPYFEKCGRGFGVELTAKLF